MPVLINRARLLTLALLGILLMAAACSSQVPQEPQPTENAVPTTEVVVTCDPEQESLDLQKISSALGYAFEPTFIPAGFEFSSSSIDRRQRANLVYRGGQQIMLIAYPITFEPQGSPTMIQLGMIQPEDAITEISISTVPGHVMRGGWSERTILAGPGIDPSLAKWDYDRSMTLFFNCDYTESEEVGIAIQSIPDGEGNLISQPDLVQVATSMFRP